MARAISIQRYDPTTDTEPKWVEYSTSGGDPSTVLETLMHIYETEDPTLAFRFGCRFGKCGLCAVEVDGRPRMACFTEVKDGMKIGPLSGMPVVRDLVIDRAAFFEGLRELQIFIPDQKETAEPQVIKEPETHKKLSLCVECLACNATCPNYDFANNSLASPYVFVKLAQLHFDPRNTIDRCKQAKDIGLESCIECTECHCIHGINIRKDVLEVLAGE
jgi:succinate dehydrogenase/fumarate reductase iron-sulfur protein